jgi:hypothetical protein
MPQQIVWLDHGKPQGNELRHHGSILDRYGMWSASGLRISQDFAGSCRGKYFISFARYTSQRVLYENQEAPLAK